MSLKRASLAGAAATLGLAFTSWSGCSDPKPLASAREITHRNQLVGGDRALGDIGDYLIENDQIRVVIQQPGYSRGFGVYGGSLIDADLRRPDEQGSSGEAVGFDQFGELFPSFFVQAVNVDRVRILSDGSDGGPARIEASGVAGDFLELAATLNRIITGSNVDINANSPPTLRYTTIYELEPGKRYITTRFRIENITSEVLSFPSADAQDLVGNVGLSLDGFTVPIGEVALFGATSKIFIPGVGYDLHFGLQRAYGRGIDWPAFPGFAAEFIASRGDGASYGLITAPSDSNYVANKGDVYDDGITPIDNSSLLVPFVASSFIGVFYQDAPAQLGPGEKFELVKHFVVGSGDVGSVLDTIYDIRGTATGRIGGMVMDSTTGAPTEDAQAIVYQYLDGIRRPFSQYDLHDGFFGGDLAPGKYSVKVVGHGRPATKLVDFTIRESETTSLAIASTPPGRIYVSIVDEAGQGLPAKATAVGRYAAEHAGKPTPSFLFDLVAGEEFRSTDLVTDKADDANTRAYVESISFTEDGTAELLVRPGKYDIVSSRGPEYNAKVTKVEVSASESVTVKHVINRVVDTEGWVAVDSHIHSMRSIDSSMDLDERVRALAAEGVEIPISTDHNYVTDFAPYIARNDLTPWMRSIVGVEMTTLESGHFNGYPLEYQVGPITHGAFEWAGRTPGTIFDDMRALGRNGPNETIIQVNHPRDEILGYFSQYRRSSSTFDEVLPGGIESVISPSGPAFYDGAGKTTFSFDFDAVELANGKLYWQMHHYRVPEQLPPGEVPGNLPPAGTILKDADGVVAFPGVIDDWFNLLNLGHRFVGVGTGDSHSSEDEAGQFRTMVFVGEDDPSAVDEQMIVDGLRSRRVVVTNGPQLDFYINDPKSGAMGKTIADGDGTVSVSVRLQSAPWISIGRVNIYRNGTIAHTIVVDEGRDLSSSPLVETIDLPLAQNAEGAPIDSWFVVEAIGYKSMFPVIRPLEIPPVVLTDAVASLAGPLGFGGDEFGALRPPEIFPVTGFAITNPVWVTLAGGEFQPPGIVPIEIQDLPENDPKFQIGIFAQSTVDAEPMSLKAQSDVGFIRLPNGRRVSMFYPRSDNWADVRKVIGRLGHLRGGHTH